jgi:DNA-binding NtrC family response regulator
VRARDPVHPDGDEGDPGDAARDADGPVDLRAAARRFEFALVGACRAEAVRACVLEIRDLVLASDEEDCRRGEEGGASSNGDPSHDGERVAGGARRRLESLRRWGRRRARTLQRWRRRRGRGLRRRGRRDRELRHLLRQRVEALGRRLRNVGALRIARRERPSGEVGAVGRHGLAEALVAAPDPVLDRRRVAHRAHTLELVERVGEAPGFLVAERLGEEGARDRERVVGGGFGARGGRQEDGDGNGEHRPSEDPQHFRPKAYEPRVGEAKLVEFVSMPTNPAGGTEVNERETAAPSGVPRLTAATGANAGRGLAMTSALATVGRHPSNDLVLDDPRVSGVHVELRRVGACVHVRDAGSTNGTWIGPHRIVEAELAVGAEVTVGGTVLRVDMDDAATPARRSTVGSFGGLVGQSAEMLELFSTLERIAPKELTVLVQGETGTGKEEVARAIHARSPRAAAPFVVIDATALPESLAESLLFGHERGAFTGADQRRAGFFEVANGGTVFLDEIGELPAPIQSKFLRVLERREITRVGGTTPVRVDVRVVAATHRDLRHEIEAGRFREDLFYRLSQMRLVLPPLRDRPGDVGVLCSTLLAQIGSKLTIEPAALAQLEAQRWPGNVRELRNVLARAAALASGPVIRRGDVAGEGFGFRGTREERAALDVSGPFAAAKERATERFESAYLAALMKRCAGNLSRAAREADVARHHLRDLLKKRGLYGASWIDLADD